MSAVRHLTAVTALGTAALHCAAFSGSVTLRSKRRAGCLRAVLPVFVEHGAPTVHARRPASRSCAPAVRVHELAQQARSVRQLPRTLRACRCAQRLQPPSPCRRGRLRFVARATWRLTGLSAAHDITRCWSQASCLDGAARGSCRAHSAAPVQPALCATGRQRIPALNNAPRSRRGSGWLSLRAALPARHPWLASPSASSVIARGHAHRLRPTPVPRAGTARRVLARQARSVRRLRKSRATGHSL